MISLRQERPLDVKAREALLEERVGDTRSRKSSQRLRKGRLPAEGLACVAADSKRVVGTARLWNIACGSGQPALLLGPVAVAADCRGRGIGAALLRRALREARRRGHGAVSLVRGARYYARFGFAGETASALPLPGPFERHRLLGLELIPGALADANGPVRATGRKPQTTQARAA